jgi:hypothetical protein
MEKWKVEKQGFPFFDSGELNLFEVAGKGE